MPVLIEEVMMAKTNKSLRVKLGGTWYGAGLDSGLNGAKGQMIEAEIETGKFGPWIKKWLPSAGQAAPAAPTAPAAPVTREREPEYAQPAKPGTVAPYWLPMASNVVSHAIAAGVVKDANQVAAWVRAVKMAVENDTSADDIPFS